MPLGAGRKHRTSLRSSSLDRRPSESVSEEENSEEDDEEEEAKSSELRKMEELLKGTLLGWPGQGGSVRGSAKSARGEEEGGSSDRRRILVGRLSIRGSGRQFERGRKKVGMRLRRRLRLRAKISRISSGGKRRRRDW